MSRLSRISIGNIDNLVNGNSVEEIGRGSIRTDRFRWNYLRVQTPTEVEVLKSRDTITMSRHTFLSYVDEVLAQKNLYLADAEYREMRGDGFLPHRLSGRFYKEKLG